MLTCSFMVKSSFLFNVLDVVLRLLFLRASLHNMYTCMCVCICCIVCMFCVFFDVILD